MRARSLVIRLRQADPVGDLGEDAAGRAARLALRELADAIEAELRDGPLEEAGR